MSTERDSYAYFSIVSSLPLSEIETHMEGKADGPCWSNGDPRKPPSKVAYHFSRWSLLSGVEHGKPINEHLAALWRRLSEYKEKIIELPEEMDAYISCVGHFKSHLDNIEISSGHYATAAYYGLKLDCDFYFDDDFGRDEEGGKPYWSW